MALLAALVAFLAVFNNATNLLGLPDAAYVPANVAIGAALVALARRRGLTWQELGLTREGLRPGLRLGLVVGAVVVIGLAIGLAVPALRPLLADERVAGLGATALAFQVLVRIPLGTAAFEEVAFRGVLLAVWARHARWWWAAAGSSALFGLWHVGPTIVALRINDVAPASPAGLAAVAGAVAVTSIAGLGFCWLRRCGRGLLAPALAHALLNGSATLAAATALRLG